MAGNPYLLDNVFKTELLGFWDYWEHGMDSPNMAPENKLQY